MIDYIGNEIAYRMQDAKCYHISSFPWLNVARDPLVRFREQSAPAYNRITVMAFVVETESVQVCIRAPHLRIPVLLDCTKVESAEGAIFAKLRKSCYHIQRLLVSDLVDTTLKQAMYGTNILETLKGLVNEKWDEVFPKPGNGGVRRYTTPKGKARKLAAPEITQISAPAVGDVGSVELRVRLSPPSAPLEIELKPENLQYLRDVMRAQLTDGGSPTKRTIAKRNADLPEGVARATGKTKYDFVANHISKDEDGVRRKVRYYTSSLSVAIDFVKTGKRPRSQSGSFGEVDTAESGEESAVDTESGEQVAGEQGVVSDESGGDL